LLAFGYAFWQYMLLYGVLFGLFIGFGYLAPMKNCFEHIPDRKGNKYVN
jgi:nitrate/nitrite transporter NarK